MKRISILVLIILTFLGFIYDGNEKGYAARAALGNKIQYSYSREVAPAVSAKGAVIIEQSSGKVLYQKNGNERMYPASTTKILTALIAIENGDLEEVVTVGDEIKLMDPSGSRAWLRVGEKMKLSDLIMGLMLPSGNDAAYTISVTIGRKIANNPNLEREEAISTFVDTMNKRAAQIGAKDSHFVNPHGFHSSEHFSTPYDLALIAREAFKHDIFRQTVKTYEYDGINTNNEAHKWENTNKLLDKTGSYYYRYATGIKTGHTTPAGYCLVSSGSKDDMDVIAVVLNTSQRGQFPDSITLLNYGLDSFIHHEVVKKGNVVQTLRVNNKQPWDDLDLNTLSSDSLKDVLNKSDIPNIKMEIKWNEELVSLPLDGADGIEILSSLKKGEILGKAVYSLNGEILGEINIEAGRDIRKRFLIFYIPGMMFIYENRYVVIPVVLLLIGVLKLNKSKHRKKKRRRKR